MKDNRLSNLKELEPDEIEELFSATFCDHCELALNSRLQSILKRKHTKIASMSSSDITHSDNIPENHSESSTKSESYKSPENNHSGQGWKRFSDRFSPTSANSKYLTPSPSSGKLSNSSAENGLAVDEQNERLRLAKVGRKTDFVHVEKIDGKNVNVVQGLELHTLVFNDEEQKKIVQSVYEFQRLGQKGRLRERTYSEPSKWMRGKGRVTIQFGCCYNYAVDKYGNPPGIIRDEKVDPLPPIFVQMIKRMVKWRVLPPTCVPNSCIVNIYDEGDCIPPHIDHHDFVRPFCTVSFLTECEILFGSNLKIVGAGEFAGPVSIPLPLGSVLVLKGNGADVAKHCVPAVPAKRISITFRKMDDIKTPYGYSLDPELRGLESLATTHIQPPSQQKQVQTKEATSRVYSKPSSPSMFSAEDDFPPLGAGNATRPRVHTKNGSKA